MSSLRMLPSLLLAIGAAGCASTAPLTSHAAYAGRQRACAPVRAEALAWLESAGRSCAADWECERHQAWLLGCGAWARTGAKLPGPLASRLDDACGPMSFYEGCGRQVGACVEGRCAGRKPSLQGCPSAQSALEAALASAPVSTCQRDADCSMEPFAQQVHAVADACWNGPGTDTGLRARACLDQRCVTGAEALEALEARPEKQLNKPTERSAGCMRRALERLPYGAVPTGRFALKFRVTASGQVQGLSLERSAKDIPLLDIAHAVGDCAWNPATDGAGRPMAVWMVQPFNFHKD